MRQFIFLILCCISLMSCKTYIDIRQSSHFTDSYKFHFYNDFNEFYYYSKVYGTSGKAIYYPNHFKIKLPKKIITWGASDNNFFFEYNSKQIIWIKSAHENSKEEKNWMIYDYCCDNIDKDRHFLWYWEERRYNSKYLSLKNTNRVSKKYSNGKIDIILFNIKEENITEYLELVKSLKLITYEKNGNGSN
ncbi:hypothetical protein KJK34_10085 [Flavobacterium sp. D11R37]|uniref:hypothetical protein n=1 Tax=Flavobacterium coralii TaxID=2838017 RepID=UPI001CA64A33|nr:hypothetical protein [Flavobacterium coralii]MBY8963100.1 hypothetical protein [Flavobacterium coralii]